MVPSSRSQPWQADSLHKKLGSLWQTLQKSLPVVIPAIPFSVVIFAVLGYTLSQFMRPFAASAWTVTLLLSLALSLTIIAATKVVFNATASPHPSSSTATVKGALPGFLKQLLPYLVLVPGICALVLSPRLQISFHGYFHAGYVYQLLNGYVPPENPILPGYPANIYWLYHALIAALVNLFEIAPPVASLGINLLAAGLAITFTAGIIHQFDLKQRGPVMAVFVLLALFGTNLFGILHVVLVRVFQIDVISLFLPGVAYLPEQPGTVSYYLEPMAFGHARLSNLWHKFLNFNGFPLGITYYTLALLVMVKAWPRQIRIQEAINLVVAVLGGLAFHTTTGLFMAVVIPTAALGAWLTCRLRPQIRVSRAGLALLLAAFVSSLPILVYVYRAAQALPMENQLAWLNLINLFSIGLAIYPLIPFFILGAGRAFRERDGATVFLAFTAAIGFALASVAVLPENNQYKFIYLAAIPTALVSITAIASLLDSPNGKSILAGKVSLGVITVLLSANLIYVGTGYLTSAWFQDKSFQFSGRHVLLHNDERFGDLFNWMRDNTSPETIVVVPPVHKADTEVFLVAERLPYVAEWDEFAARIPEYEARLMAIEVFYAADSTSGQRADAAEYICRSRLNRPVIFVVPKYYMTPAGPDEIGLGLLYPGAQAHLLQCEEVY